MPQWIELLIKNWKTTAPGLGMVGGVIYSILLRWHGGGDWFPTQVEVYAILGGVIGIYAKVHNVTGGDQSNGLTPNPVQQAQAQIDVALASAEPIKPPVDAAAVIAIKKQMDEFGEKVKTDMEAMQRDLAKAMGQR